MKNNWYAFNAAEEVTTIDILEAIVFWEITAKDFIEKLNAVTTPKIMIRINSPGGDVFDGTAIFNAIKAHPAKVEVHVIGIAASIASVIAMAADKIVMADGSFMMIHNPWSFAIGDAKDLRETADVLEQIEESLADIYEKRTGMKNAAIRDLMDEETWMGPQEAVDKGFADRIADQADASALVHAREFDFSDFDQDRLPKDLITQQGLAFAQTKREAEKALRDVDGMTRARAKQIVQTGFKKRSGSENSSRDAGAIQAANERIKQNNLKLKNWSTR